MLRFLRLFAALFALVAASAATAEVRVTFHSFNGSMPFGRFPHAFVSFDGTLDATGAPVKENFGWSAKNISPAVLQGPVYGIVLVEKDKWLTQTNRHFTIALTDAQYHALRAEVEAYRTAPGKYYSLADRNCIHFVGRMAELLGLKVEYPREMMRKPRQWLNRIGDLNPQLGAKKFG
jgi:hypothetical protein